MRRGVGFGQSEKVFAQRRQRYCFDRVVFLRPPGSCVGFSRLIVPVCRLIYNVGRVSRGGARPQRSVFLWCCVFKGARELRRIFSLICSACRLICIVGRVSRGGAKPQRSVFLWFCVFKAARELHKYNRYSPSNYALQVGTTCNILDTSGKHLRQWGKAAQYYL